MDLIQKHWVVVDTVEGSLLLKMQPHRVIISLIHYFCDQMNKHLEHICLDDFRQFLPLEQRDRTHMLCENWNL